MLPPPTAHSYNLRPRRHNLTIPSVTSTLGKCNFLTRQLSKDVLVYTYNLALKVCVVISQPLFKTCVRHLLLCCVMILLELLYILCAYIYLCICKCLRPVRHVSLK
jgi:hypothetical protein